MNESRLKSIFPRASIAFLKANAELQSAVPQSDTKTPLGSTTKGKEKGVGRIALSYRIYRVRLQDTDNACASTKNITDGLARSELIPGDAPDQISLTVEQEKVSTFSDERVEITIKWPQLSQPSETSCKNKKENTCPS